jgi:hypothetical protein
MPNPAARADGAAVVEADGIVKHFGPSSSWTT